MAARLAFRVEPPVVAGGEFKRKFLVLEVVLADINVKALGRAVVERMAGDFLLLTAPDPPHRAQYQAPC